MSEIIVRTAKKTDYPALERIYFIDRYRDFPWVSQPQLTDFERDSRHEYILVAIIDQKIVGFLSFYRLANFIHLLFVDPAYRHQHVGYRLIETMRQSATGLMQLKVVTANFSARAFYERLGFQETKRDDLATPPNITLTDTRRDRYPFLARQ